MATVIGLGVQFTANASGMTKGLSQVDRQLQNLGKQAGQAARLFDGFASSSAAASAAQQQVATDIAFLGSALRTGQVTAEQYAAELQAIVGSAQQQAAAFAEGARITEQVATAEERRAATLERLGQLLATGAINEETYSRAAAEASGENEAAAKAESDRAAALARAAQITQANLSPQQKYDQQVQELSGHLAAGRITQETYSSALNKAAADFAKATIAANKYDASVEAAGDGGTLKFNELSGALAAIPGPIGNVAGRLSGLTSAGEGLGRVFSGGLSQGLAGIGTSVAGLVNPFTAGLAALTAFAAGASQVARSLTDLDSRVERLGNLADQLGISFEFVQVLEESANRSGVSVETLAGSMTRLQRTLAGADEESKSAQAALGRLGISIQQLNGLTQEEQIALVGDRIAAIEDPAKRTAAAVALFGRSGAQLLPFFNNLGPAADDIERFGGGLNDIDRARIDSFGDGLDALRVASSQLGDSLVTPFAGLGEGIALGAAEFLGGINAIVGPIGEVLEPALTSIGVAIRLVGKGIGEQARFIGLVLKPIANTVQYIRKQVEDLSTSLDQWLDRWYGITAEIEAPVVAEFDVTQPTLAATQFAEQIGSAAAAASEFGDAGFEAALAYQTGLEQIAQLLADETLTSEEAKRAAELEKAAFEAKIDALEGEADAQRKSAEEAQKAADKKIEAAQRAADAQIDADRRLADSFIESQGIGSQDDRAKAQETLLAITRQIDETETAIVEARAAGDAQAEASATRRLAILDQAQAAAQQTVELGFSTQDAQNAIAEVRADLDQTFTFDNFQIAPEAFETAQEQLRELEQSLLNESIDPATFELAADAIRAGFEDALDTAQEIAKLNEQYAEQAADIERERLANLAQTGPTTVQASDLRTSEGASQFLRLATGQQDPAIEEYRKQLSKLDEIRREIAKVGGTVEIVGAS